MVKYRRCSTSAGALISEVVCCRLLRVIGIRTLDAVLVALGDGLATDYQRKGLVDYKPLPGLHFGTVFRHDTESGPPVEWEQLASPHEIIQIWCADCWLMNLDRNNEGNIRLELGNAGCWHLIAADQSDCFLGSGALADGSCIQRSNDHGAAPQMDFLERAVVECGLGPLEQMISRIRAAVGQIPGVLAAVPDEWWQAVSTERNDLEACLRERANRIHTLINYDHWRGLGDATRGGLTLNL